jgi:hypothetical protein
VIKK